MLIAVLTALALSAGAGAPTDAGPDDPDPAPELIRVLYPQYDPATGRLDKELWAAENVADVRADGTALLVMVTAWGDADFRRIVGTRVYSFRKKGATWQKVSDWDLHTGDIPVQSVDVTGDDWSPAPGVKLAQVTYQIINDGEGNTDATLLYRVDADGALQPVHNCTTFSGGDGYPHESTDCKMEELPGGWLSEQVHTSSCDEDQPCEDHDTQSFYLWNGTKLVETKRTPGAELRIQSAKASSELFDAKLPPDYYAADKAIDGRESSAWAEGVDGPGVGAWIQFQLASPTVVTGLHLLATCGANPGRRKLNERLKTVRVTADSGQIATVQLKNVTEAQDVKLAFSKPTSSLKLEIVAVYPGAKYQDACLSELRLLP